VQYVLPGFGDLKVSRRAMQTWPFSSLSVRGIWQARGFPALPYCEFYIRLELQDSSCTGNHSLIFMANLSLWDMSFCLIFLLTILFSFLATVASRIFLFFAWHCPFL
jgi:hypothetical protein